MPLTPQQHLSNLLAEIAKQPIDSQERIKNMAEAVTEFLREKGPEAYMALALVSARTASRGVL